MQYGVSDFVEKPWTNTRLLEIHRSKFPGPERRESRPPPPRRAAREEALIHQQEQEREIASKSIQEKLLPREIHNAGYEIASAWQSARLVGGDYLTFFRSTRKCWICIADVREKACPPRC